MSDIDRQLLKDLNRDMVTKKDIEILKGTFVTKKDLKDMKVEFKKVFATKRDLIKMEKRIINAVANMSVNSPTSNQFNELERRVIRLETSVN